MRGVGLERGGKAGERGVGLGGGGRGERERGDGGRTLEGVAGGRERGDGVGLERGG